jgi:hypothetical protein
MFREVVQDIRKELAAFDKAYNKTFGASINFASAWEQALR